MTTPTAPTTPAPTQRINQITPAIPLSIDPTVKPYTYTDFAADTDKPFIYSTWVNSYSLSQTSRMCRSEAEYKRLQCEIIEAILHTPSTQIYVTRVLGEPDSILSYAVLDCVHKCLHYTYTKFNYRSCALSQNLCLGKGMEYYSHNRAVNHEQASKQSFKHEHLVPKWAIHLRYHPYIIVEIVRNHGIRIGHEHGHGHSNHTNKTKEATQSQP